MTEYQLDMPGAPQRRLISRPGRDGEWKVRVHCIPIGDVPHAAQDVCWCIPTEVTPNVFAHHSADGREYGELLNNESGEPGWQIVDEYNTAAYEVL